MTVACLLRDSPRIATSGVQDVIVVIPVRNEAQRVRRLLVSVAAAANRCHLPVRTLVFANNCEDLTVDVARQFLMSGALEGHVRYECLPGETAFAGFARHRAMALASGIAAENTLLMTTDGDAVVDPYWITSAVQAANAGADLICGTISTSCEDVLKTVSGSRITSAEAAYSNLLHEVRFCMDRIAGRQPLAGRRPHYMESGACIAIRADRYRDIGGIPATSTSEDRGLVFRAEAHGLNITYADAMAAWVSGRLDGRADGGMSACLRERMTSDDPLADQAMLPLEVVQRLWERTLAGERPPYPDRSLPVGPRLRASDLEAGLPALAEFVSGIVKPAFELWAAPMKILDAG